MNNDHNFHPVRNRTKSAPPKTNLPNIETTAFSAAALEVYAEKAATLAADLRKKEPTYELALAAGIQDRSYSTVRWGRVASYYGEVIIEMADGRRWKAVGHGPRGAAEYIAQHGWIEFIPLP